MNTSGEAPSLQEFEETLRPLLTCCPSSFEEAQQASQLLLFWATRPSSERTALIVMNSTQTNKHYYLLAAIILEFRIHQPCDPVYDKIGEVITFLRNHIISNQHEFNELYYQKYIKILADISLIMNQPIKFPEGINLNIVYLYLYSMVTRLDHPIISGFFTLSYLNDYTNLLLNYAYNFLKSAPFIPSIEWAQLFSWVCMHDQNGEMNFSQLERPFTYIPETFQYAELHSSMKDVLIYILKRDSCLFQDLLDDPECEYRVSAEEIQMIINFFSHIVHWCCMLANCMIKDQNYDDMFELWTEMVQNPIFRYILTVHQNDDLLTFYLSAFSEAVKAFMEISCVSIIVDMITHMAEFIESAYKIQEKQVLKNFIHYLFNIIISIADSHLCKNIILLSSIRTFYDMYPDIIIASLFEHHLNPTNGFFFVCSAFNKLVKLPEEVVNQICPILFNSLGSHDLCESALGFILSHLSYLVPFFDQFLQLFQCETGQKLFKNLTTILTSFILEDPNRIRLIPPELVQKISSSLDDFDKGYENYCFRSSALFILTLSKFQQEDDRRRSYAFVQNSFFKLTQLILKCAAESNPKYFDMLRTFNDATMFLGVKNFEEIGIGFSIQFIQNLVNWQIPSIDAQRTIAILLTQLFHSNYIPHTYADTIISYLQEIMSNFAVFSEHFRLISELSERKLLKPFPVLPSVLSLETMLQINDDNVLFEATRFLRSLTQSKTTSNFGFCSINSRCNSNFCQQNAGLVQSLPITAAANFIPTSSNNTISSLNTNFNYTLNFNSNMNLNMNNLNTGICNECMCADMNGSGSEVVWNYMNLNFLVVALSTNCETAQEESFLLVDNLINNCSIKPSNFVFVIMRTIILSWFVVYESYNYEEALRVCLKLMEAPESTHILQTIIQEVAAKCEFLHKLLSQIQNVLINYNQNPEHYRMLLYQVLGWKNSLNSEEVSIVRTLIYTMN
ncbi:hypothetical protein TRFO_14233 [Tritrichomonas foetus]|uniref:Uncharacterized protein n=1 Tax=Tritrichomonas foetus TaxID=1144522 RepID=A0A1J4KW08_9EUKA|nr:hypothetical protein TRFO_14233 [Tritrichomonas foetus]|eukprot:OHT15322.1 hypothetical protein TRFO_14233 [Tritrichomonas foetus]